jgi:hypothetical protein
MKLDPQEILEKAETNKVIFENFFNIEEEAWRSAILELALEALGYSPIDLWEENKLVERLAQKRAQLR